MKEGLIRKGSIGTDQLVILIISAVMVMTLIAVISGGISDGFLNAVGAALQ